LCKTYDLALHGRYYSFPNLSAAVPAVGILALLLLRALRRESLTSPLWNTRSVSWQSGVRYGLVLLGTSLLLAEVWSFYVSPNFVAAYPEATKRLTTVFTYTLSTGQLRCWAVAMFVLALPAAWQTRLHYGLWLLGIGLLFGESWAFYISRDFIAAYPEVVKRATMAFTYTLSNMQLLRWLGCVIVLTLPLTFDKTRAPSVA
jgi:hypothetical protein